LAQAQNLSQMIDGLFRAIGQLAEYAQSIAIAQQFEQACDFICLIG
jgi:hypothetical protein